MIRRRRITRRQKRLLVRVARERREEGVIEVLDESGARIVAEIIGNKIMLPSGKAFEIPAEETV